LGVLFCKSGFLKVIGALVFSVLPFVFLSSESTAELIEGEVYFLKVSEAPLYGSPGGEKAGMVLQEAPLRVRGEYEGWVNVKVNLWVEKEHLAVERKSSLRLLSYDRKTTREEDIDITLTLKNYGQEKITMWDGLLTLRNVIEEPLFRVRLKNENVSISPGDEYEITARLSKEQVRDPEVFDYLRNFSKDLIIPDLQIIRVETQEY